MMFISNRHLVRKILLIEKEKGILIIYFDLPGVVSCQDGTVFPPGYTRRWHSTYNTLKHCRLVNVH